VLASSSGGLFVDYEPSSDAMPDRT